MTFRRPLVIAFVLLLVLLVAGGCRSSTPTSGKVSVSSTSVNGSTHAPGGSSGAPGGTGAGGNGGIGNGNPGGGTGGGGTTTPPFGAENSEP
jgi:hypothetical protein